MKILCLALFALLAVRGETITGTVSNSATGAPIFGVTVEFHSGASTVSAVTDGQGVFRVESLAPGKYSVKYARHGFITRYRDAVVANAPLRLSVTLKPYGTISGRVLGPGGRPIAGARIACLRDGNATAVEAVNARGEFFLEDVEPGAWNLLALPPEKSAAPAADDGSARTWVRTYYPGTSQPEAAATVTVAPGAALSGYDIVLRAVPVRRLRGRVVNLKGDSVGGAAVLLLPIGEWYARGDRPPIHAATDGSFEFSVYDGPWKVEVEIADPPSYADMRVEVAKDGDDLELCLKPPFSIAGRIVADASPGSRAPAPGVLLLQAKAMPRFFSSKKPDDGVFRIDGVPEGAYRVIVSSLPSPWYLDSVRLGGREILGEDVELHSGAIPLTITLKAEGGAVRGTVEECGGGAIVLVPRDARLIPHDLVRTAACRPGGVFEIRAVRPGDYYAYAFSEPPDRMYERLTLAPMTNQAVRVTVRPNESTLVNLKAIPRP